MRTKTLLIAAATLATGLLASKADNVYSANVVGYANVVIPGANALTMVATPLSAATNSGSVVLTALTGGESIYLWNGAGYYVYNYAPGAQLAGYPSDWVDVGAGDIPGDISQDGNLWAPAPNIPPGTAYFIQNPNSAITNSFVGTVVLSNTNSPKVLPGGNALTMAASVAPVGGDLQTNALLGLPLQGGENVYLWNGAGYYSYNYAPGAKLAGYPSDWVDVGAGDIPGDISQDGNLWAPAPTISVGQGFFYQNPNSTTNWTQNITLQ